MLHMQDLAMIPAQLQRKKVQSSSSFLVFICRESHIVSVAWSEIHLPREKDLPLGYLSRLTI